MSAEQFTPLWATPQHVDLEAMCRAQGLPHQRVARAAELLPALRAAWGLNRHSVVEVSGGAKGPSLIMTMHACMRSLWSPLPSTST